MRPRVLIAVTHLLGSGHLVRAGHLADALAAGGFDVTLASGGMPLPRAGGAAVETVQLPPVKVEGVDFRNLMDEEGRPVEATRLGARRDMLNGLAARLRPAVVITEHFPFGRRQLADEFLGLVAAARAANPDALVLASVRDVLVTPRADRIAEAEQRIAAHFDAVLVHGDASFLPLGLSWPVSAGLAELIRYTGYLTGPETSEPPQENDEIIVSGGGSAASLPLFEIALAAARAVAGRRWRILAGRGVPEAAFARMKQSAPRHVEVERARHDFPALLAGCALSISQAGYNTVLDLVRAGRPAIVVPFDAGNETEQAVRAAAMERAGLARCLRLTGPGALTPERLAAAVQAMLGAPRTAAATIDREGAANVAGIVKVLLAEGRRAYRRQEGGNPA